MKKIKREFIVLLLILMSANAACNYNRFEEPNRNVAVNAENQKSNLEADLQTMRTADLKYIFVFRRKDAGAFNSEDKRFLRINLPTTNRVVLSDDGKAFVVGTNYKFPPENLEVLQLRFNIEDFSAQDVKKE